MKIKHPDFIISGEYVNVNSIMHVVHNKCGYEWETRSGNLYTHGCPKCGNSIRETQQGFEEKVKKSNPFIKILGKYRIRKEKIEVQDIRCGHIYKALPSNILTGHCCPYCTGRSVLEGFNDVASTNPEMIELFANIEDSKKYTANSHKKVLMKCPECGHEEMKSIKGVHTQGFSCSYCSDGISYPNKYARAFLKQFDLDVLTFEFSPEWEELGARRYDNYFEYNGKKYILEMDGDLHYKESGFRGSLSDVQANDMEKDLIAIAHQVIPIRIDCRKSQSDYIKNNLLNSELSNVLNMSHVDWNKCNEFASSNFLRYTCDFYIKNKYDMTYGEFAKYFNINITTFSTYKKRWSELGWINEDKDEKSLLRSIHSKSKRSIPVSVYDIANNHIKDFNSCSSAAHYMSAFYNKKFNNETISNRVKYSQDKLYNGFYFKHKN